jgi:hypothetical protein
MKRWALVMPVMSLGLMTTRSISRPTMRRRHSRSLESQASRTFRVRKKSATQPASVVVGHQRPTVKPQASRGSIDHHTQPCTPGQFWVNGPLHRRDCIAAVERSAPTRAPSMSGS